MQDRYVGDVGDFGKFSLLRILMSYHPSHPLLPSLIKTDIRLYPTARVVISTQAAIAFTSHLGQV